MGSSRGRNRKPRSKALAPGMSALAQRPGKPVASAVSFTQALNALTGQQSVGNINPLPRDPYDENPFGPLTPLRAQPIDPNRRDTGRPEPRLSQYDVGWNIPGSGTRRVPWQLLRETSRGVDVLRRCIQIRKSHVTGLKWSWTLTAEAVEQAMVDGKHTSRLDAESALREKLLPDIRRLTEFWKRPWRGNNLSFRQWMALVLEEILSIDALAIYPRLTLGGQLLDLEILDGSTVKPLRDWRGATPTPPYPAYQQDLYGFPRGEFTASVIDTPDGQVVPGAYASDQLYYYRSVPFADTPYGMSAVEQALVSARLYLMRQGWMLAEYDDGVSPNTWLVAEKEVASLGNEPFTAQKRREWQQALNDELSGNTHQRQRVQLTPPGFSPHFPAPVDSKYKPEYDQHLITLLTSHLDVTMAEYGFSMTGGLGATGFHEGQEDVQFRKATKPTCEMLQEIVQDLSRMFLGAPPELTFTFLGLEQEDEAASDAVADIRVASGRMTLNEDRDRLGKPRFTFAEADMPFLKLSRGVVFLDGASQDPTATGMTAPGEQAKQGAPGQTGDTGDPGDSGFAGQPPATAPKALTATATAEISAYNRWKSRAGNHPKRPFEFKSLTAQQAVTHHVIDPGDIDVTVSFPPGAALPKAAPPAVNDWPGWAKDRQTAAVYAQRIREAVTAVATAHELAVEWNARRKASHADPSDARAWITARNLALAAALRAVLADLYTEGYLIGDRSAQAVLALAVPDWSTWTPGDPDAARLLLGQDGLGSGLAQLLDEQGASISSIAANRLEQLAQVLADGAANGDSVEALASALADVLDDPTWADLVASTELTRAVSASTLAIYLANGVTGYGWMTAEDERVCPVCSSNEDDGVLPVGAAFSSGDSYPPAHPRCRCALEPAVDTGPASTADEGV